MSVIIKGIRMPINCAECVCGNAQDGWCYVNELPLRRLCDGRVDISRPEWCPLVEIPTPHGRLIDADALIENANFYETEMETKEAPTVIDAEADHE